MDGMGLYENLHELGPAKFGWKLSMKFLETFETARKRIH